MSRREAAEAHVGVDAESGLVHTMVGTAANVADVTQAHDLLHGKETVAFGDAGYAGVANRPERKRAIDWHVAMKPGKRRRLGKTSLLMECPSLGRLCSARLERRAKSGPGRSGTRDRQSQESGISCARAPGHSGKCHAASCEAHLHRCA